MGAFPRLRYEVRMMAKLNHPCVLELVGVSIKRLAFAMELLPSGDLASYISDVYKQRIREFVAGEVVHESVLPRKLSFKIAYQLASVISYLHSAGVIHADIKTNNVLLFSTDIRSPINIKLADYGISHEMDVGGVRGDVGRNVFCAPEIIKGLAFDEKIDWFSYAIFLYHLISGTIPFQDETYLATISQVTSGSRPDFKYFNYSMRPQLPNVEGLMEECWRENPDDRPSGKAVIDTMQDLSFMCLRRRMALQSESTAVLYTNCDDQNDTDNKYFVYIWNHDGQVIERDVATGDINGKVIKVADQEEIDQVLCACAFDRTHVVGTSKLIIQT
ncbi:leucine-rich repeat serine/threonine-protein kinase 1-like [Amphiura filiformis]|uniref:leucine-rich repeat serine/threonine-protein kinase 1-like n=1 Tax=Amphiura filiformis TaxID=82378 RepID=UPI003B22122C